MNSQQNKQHMNEFAALPLEEKRKKYSDLAYQVGRLRYCLQKLEEKFKH